MNRRTFLAAPLVLVVPAPALAAKPVRYPYSHHMHVGWPPQLPPGRLKRLFRAYCNDLGGCRLAGWDGFAKIEDRARWWGEYIRRHGTQRLT